MVPLCKTSGKKQWDAKHRARSVFSDFWKCPNYVLFLVFLPFVQTEVRQPEVKYTYGNISSRNLPKAGGFEPGWWGGCGAQVAVLPASWAGGATWLRASDLWSPSRQVPHIDCH